MEGRRYAKPVRCGTVLSLAEPVPMLDSLTPQPQPHPHRALLDGPIATTAYGAALDDLERAARDACRRAIAREGPTPVELLRVPVERFAAAAAAAGHSPEAMLRRTKLLLRAYCLCHEQEGAQIITHAIDAYYRVPAPG